MSVTFTTPKEFRYVGAAILSTIFLLQGQSFIVNKWRKKSGIKYPQMYAEKAEAMASPEARVFNCAQRAHQNTLENIPIVWATTLMTGLEYPILAASLCGFWTLSRISYTRGYVSGDPAQRVSVLYLLGSAGLASLLVTSTFSIGKAIFKSL